MVKTDAPRAVSSLWRVRFDRFRRQSPRQQHSAWDRRNGQEASPESGSEARPDRRARIVAGVGEASAEAQRPAYFLSSA